MAGFNDPIAGSLGNLLIQQIKSPNFDQATQTGWAILKNGSAFFYSVTVSGTVIVGVAPNAQITLLEEGGIGIERFLTNAALEANAANMVAGTAGSGSGEFLDLTISGAQATSQDDFVSLGFRSANDGASSSANLGLDYTDTGGIEHEYANLSAAGFIISTGRITAVEPGTGTVATPAVAESWHVGALINSWAGSGSGVNGLYYRLLPLGPSGMLEVVADVQNSSATGTSAIWDTPAGYQPAGSYNFPAMWNNPQTSNAASAPWVFVQGGGSGGVALAGIEVANKEIAFHILVPMESL